MELTTLTTEATRTVLDAVRADAALGALISFAKHWARPRRGRGHHLTGIALLGIVVCPFAVLLVLIAATFATNE